MSNYCSKVYLIHRRDEFRGEAKQVEKLSEDILATSDGLQALGAQWLFEQMVSAHELVKSLRLEQGVEESEKVTGAVKAARQKCDELYDKITYLIEAFALAADDPVPYEAFIKRWNGTLKLYQDTLGRKSGTPSGGGGGNNNGDNAGGSGDNGNSGDTPAPTPEPTSEPDPSGGGENPDPEE